ncbi:TPA: hypothetical protein JK846_003553 [Escherichia coli]|nr:hypothetical protein [Salmonella enterica]EJF7575638.1 hypothetical protein [Salmonella enterica subsp. enterica]HAV7961441.1 hypothetical protein [Escherichia coli]
MAAQDVNVLNPNLNQGRDYNVPAQVDKNGKSIVTGEAPTNANDVYQAEHAAALKKNPVEEPDWGYNPIKGADVNPAAIPQKPANPNPDDVEAVMAGIWTPNPEDGEWVAQREFTENKEALPLVQPDFAYNPIPKAGDYVPPIPKKAPNPNPDDPAAVMKTIWTPNPSDADYVPPKPQAAPSQY